MRLADKIMKLRYGQGISQKQLAKHMGVSRQTVYKWEADLSVPEIDKIKTMAEYFNVSCDELLNDNISLPIKKNNKINALDNETKNAKIFEENQLEQHQDQKQSKTKQTALTALALILILILIITVISCTFILNRDNSTDTDTNTDTPHCAHYTYVLTAVIEKETCVSNGKKVLECKNCGFRQERIIPSKKHIYVDNECVLCHSLKISDGIIYGIDEHTNTAYVKSKGKCIDNHIVIAEKYNGCKVTKIGKEAFMYSNFKSIKIPDSVTEIEDKAFFFCSELTDISFGNSVKVIGEYAFYHCGKFEQIIFPDSLEIIGKNAFTSTKINKVLMGKSIKKIDCEAFLNCEITFFKFRERGKWEVYSTLSNNQEFIDVYPDENKSKDINIISTYGIVTKIE